MAEKQTDHFESAVARLEAIVQAMESGELPLEELLVRYEEGTRLVKFCAEKLDAAEKRIETVTRNAAGEAKVEPVRTAKGAGKPAEDVSLF